MRYWVVFLNDMALCACTSQAQADAEVAARKAKYRAEAEKSCAGWQLKAAIDTAYFHWHEVPASKL